MVTIYHTRVTLQGKLEKGDKIAALQFLSKKLHWKRTILSVLGLVCCNGSIIARRVRCGGGLLAVSSFICMLLLANPVRHVTLVQ